MKKILVFTVLAFAALNIKAQAVPSEDENIPFLMTFGNKAEISWGDDDFSQTFFFVVPEAYKGLVFIKIFDPDIGGMYDELNGVFDTKMKYSVYGGKEAYTSKKAQSVNPEGPNPSGNLLATQTFGVNARYDNKWYAFGPFSPTAGELVPQFGGYIFKVICDGIEGDDGNMYRYFLSSSATENIPIEGGNAFSYEYSFRMHDDSNEISHIYPYVSFDCIAIKQSNFDWDDDGVIRVSSEVRREKHCDVSGDAVWIKSEFVIQDGEKGKSLDFQFIKRKPPVKNNNVVINIENQYGELLPFFTIPIGGVPKYKYDIGSRKKSSSK
ncbi:MAG: hypothetical protein LBH90_05295 [Tannerella sp.]|nr:hypothetical protein [Tannerella sp.]